MGFRYSYRKVAKPFANSGDHDQTPHSAASDLGLHCLPITLLGISRLQWVKPKSVCWIFFLFLYKNIYCWQSVQSIEVLSEALLMNTLKRQGD